MKQKILLTIGLIIVLFLTACGSADLDHAMQGNTQMDESTKMMKENSDSFDFGYDDMETAEEDLQERNNTSGKTNDNTSDRMIIHTANLYINVKDLTETQLVLEEKVAKYGGYIVESNIYRMEDEYLSGNMTIRIPEQHFQTFLTVTEETAVDVVERVITGQDVTESYVDLASRLKSKKVVEERLLSFMEDATKTDDLLTISADLAAVQEEIEVITGKMNYLENQAAYSTIEISMSEDKVIVPEIEHANLDTWEKTKKQFSTSINSILSVASSFIIFFLGNIPVIALIIIAGFIIYLIIRRNTNKKA